MMKRIWQKEEDLKKSVRNFWNGAVKIISSVPGPMDLTELQTNMAFYYMDKLPRPLKFLNLQQIYANMVDPTGSTVSKLEKAVADFNIPEDEPFHSAVNDARYTALVLKEMHPRNLKDLYSFDLYIHPTKRKRKL